MKRILFSLLLAASLSAEAQTQTYETEFARPLNEVLTDIQNRFGIRLKYDIDTVGKILPYADFRIRPYSVEESLTNVLSPFDYKFVRQSGNLYKLKAYEYPRRTDADGEKMLAYLNTLYADKQAFELRADSLRKIEGYLMFALMNFISSRAPPGNSGMTAATSNTSVSESFSESESFTVIISPDIGVISINPISWGSSGNSCLFTVSFSTIGIVSSTGVGHISPNITLALVESLIVSWLVPLLGELLHEVIGAIATSPADIPNIVMAFPAIRLRSSCCSR